jgi:hypothetical protein
MDPEIEKLIDLALADGQITEKERGIILRKAEKLGEDLDEVEMILDGKIALMNNELVKSQTQELKSNKEGDLRKCPSCGAPVESFKTKCTECNHEFRNTAIANAVKDFFQKYNNIEIEERKRTEDVKEHWANAGMNSIITNNAIIKRQISLISSFPVPNTKEDMLEFLSISIPEATKNMSLGFIGKLLGSAHKDFIYVQLKNTWHSKSEQIIMKARISMKEDKKTLEEIEYYAKQLDIK